MKNLLKIVGAVALVGAIGAVTVAPAEAQSFSFGIGTPGFHFGVSNGYHQPYYRPQYRPYYHNDYNPPHFSHRDACSDRYRSYDWRSDTYLGTDHHRHLCRL